VAGRGVRLTRKAAGALSSRRRPPSARSTASRKRALLALMLWYFAFSGSYAADTHIC
jgi:hypothetical protein